MRSADGDLIRAVEGIIDSPNKEIPRGQPLPNKVIPNHWDGKHIAKPGGYLGSSETRHVVISVGDRGVCDGSKEGLEAGDEGDGPLFL